MKAAAKKWRKDKLNKPSAPMRTHSDHPIIRTFSVPLGHIEDSGVETMRMVESNHKFLPSLTMVERPQFLVNSSFITPFPRDILGHELMRKLGSDAKFDNIYTELYRLKVEELVELLEPDGRPISIETSPLKEESNSRI